tara:strand:- start:404 stop:625 length:222 start_codon:yes stop_codon:yes gene_type:complete
MDDGLPQKVTKEEKMEELMVKALELGKEIVSTQIADIENETGETVDVKKPKAESVPDVKGRDEEETNITEFEG